MNYEIVCIDEEFCTEEKFGQIDTMSAISTGRTSR